MSKVIDKIRELGVAIQQDESYINYIKAKAANDCDTELQDLIAKFNETKIKLNTQMAKPDKDTDAITALNSELNRLYEAVMSNENMIAFENAKAGMDRILDSVNYIVTAAANGEDPMTCAETAPASCTGSCGTCGGCG